MSHFFVPMGQFNGASPPSFWKNAFISLGLDLAVPPITLGEAGLACDVSGMVLFLLVAGIHIPALYLMLCQ
jgi:hypothetical protein